MAYLQKTKSYDELTFADNFLFCKILESDQDLCKDLIELLLDIKIDHLESPIAERTMQESFDAKSVRFDVYTKDDKRIFDLEMQTTAPNNLSKRARYYQSVIDMDNLSHGESYIKLKDSYVIFLCLDDVFKKGLPVYSFENICNQDKRIKLNDRTYKIFFNAKNCDKLKTEEQKDFFKFLKGSKAASSLSRRIEKKVEYAKKNPDWRRNYMTWQQTIDEEKALAFEEGKSEGRSEGVEIGLLQGAQTNAIENARNLLKEDDSVEKIARCCSLPLEQVIALQKELAEA